MSTRRAWSLLTVENGELRYGGNDGYNDELSRSYRYDSDVANCKQISVGDLVFLRNKQDVLGTACIEKIRITENSRKIRNRCPSCRATGIKLRKMSSDWRCQKCGSEFKEPLSEIVEVKAFEAIYEHTFVSLVKTIPLSVLKAAILRPSDQMSIAEVDFSVLEVWLLKNHSGIVDLIERYVASHSLAPEDAVVVGVGLVSRTAPLLDTYMTSNLDTRKAVLRNILARRGQKQFRYALIKRYGATCMVSGCSFLGVLEAAHIDAYRGCNHNHLENGLLLRADLHTLFDLGLLAIDPDSLEVRLSRNLKDVADYAALERVKLRVSTGCTPSKSALKNRWTIFLNEF